MVVYKFNPKDCPVGIENKIKIEGIGKDIQEIKDSIGGLDTKVTDLFNHQSNRLPAWATAIITILSSIVTGISVFLLTRGI